ncbi:hypothetical protein F8M41_008541 [Gigaspora margarita]|uniref:Uncharacterized protein n=1 Tax=Gigaspora margarita TaxID=4874 RepID=A0A8H4B486_GIGMA|nr:hypothetical protein F8M41_008541 [Gigaspora margarita]
MMSCCPNERDLKPASCVEPSKLPIDQIVKRNKQAAEAQEIINEAFKNHKLDDEQIPRALEFIVKILEEIIREEEENIIYLPLIADEMNTVVPCCENGVKIKKDKIKELGLIEEILDSEELEESDIGLRTKRVNLLNGMRSAKDGFATGQFDPGGPYDQNGVSLENSVKVEKKRVTNF